MLLDVVKPKGRKQKLFERNPSYYMGLRQRPRNPLHATVSRYYVHSARNSSLPSGTTTRSILKYHFSLAHPNADPKKYNHLWDISSFEIQEMKKKWADRHHVPVKRARKSKSAPLVIYDAHRSRIPPTGRWVQIIICWKVAEIEMSSAMTRNLKGYQTKIQDWVSELTFCQDFNVKLTYIFLLNHFSIT